MGIARYSRQSYIWTRTSRLSYTEILLAARFMTPKSKLSRHSGCVYDPTSKSGMYASLEGKWPDFSLPRMHGNTGRLSSSLQNFLLYGTSNGSTNNIVLERRLPLFSYRLRIRMQCCY